MLTVRKNPGETMAQFVSRVKKLHNINKLAYTARLDPMAKGIVPFVIENNCANINEYLGSGKTYQVKIIYGMQTDSDDPLGLIINKMNVNKDSTLDITKSIINYLNLINNTTFKQKYHHFSTKMLNHRRQKSIGYTDNHLVSLHNYQVVKSGIIDFKHWVKKIINQINSIDPKRNFRQGDTISQWEGLDIKELDYIKLSLSVSSGFFVRQLVRDMSDAIGVPLMAYSINRISVE
jgi:tRNA pseudouridine(55) synthase